MLHLGHLQQQTQPAAGETDWPACFRQLADSTRDDRLRRYYARGMVTGDTLLSATPLMALDLETTGLDPVRDGIVSIGLVPMQVDRIFASRARHWLLKPRVALAEESVTIHGITDAQLDNAPDLTEVLDEVLQYMAGHVVVVHCSAIERGFLNGALRPRLGEGIEFPTIDTMELEARFHRKKRPGLITRLLGHKQPSIRLAACRNRYGLPRYRPHHALTDALACAELLQAQIAYRFSPDTPVKVLWS
ncbi:3'-5' exonuclease [Azoarcus sp. L1K30]|uniref:3'-5' exonuclease n=1 Tax=Azoarcus sp. L1K30 TaxID=2820277 RepID=UPI001B829050|nr:3'-5' exonuclease [Azoarcus sp. L1K30]